MSTAFSQRRGPPVFDLRLALLLVVGVVAGAWCLHVVAGATDVRSARQERAGQLRELEGALRALHTHGPGSPQVASALEGLGELGGLQEGTAVAAAGQTLVARAGQLRLAIDDDLPSKTDDRVAVFVAADELAAGIWSQHELLDEELDSAWVSLRALALMALGLAAVALGLLMVIRRRRFEAEELGRRLRDTLLQAERAQKRAQEASQAKSEFLATISHEIRTPMTAVLGSAELMCRGALDPQQRDQLAVIKTGGESLLSLINEVLDLSAIEAGRLTIEPVETQLEDLLEGVALLFAGAARDRGLELTVVVDGALPERVSCDGARIRQVLVNLVGNAVKFTDEGSVAVRARGLGRARVRFEVQDTGPGLEPDTHEAIFAPFEQLDGSPTRNHGGSGLGLAICRRIVDALGGDLLVDSEAGHGARFHFDLALPGLSPPPEPPDVSAVRVAGEGPAPDAIRAQLASWGIGEDPAARLWIGEGEPPDGVEALPLIDFGEVGPPLAVSRPIRPRQLRRVLSGVVPVRSVPGVAAPEPDERGPLRVLLVDDNPINRKVIGQLLVVFGCSVGEAGSAREALEICRSDRWDLVLMDYDMPDIDGFEATRAIRACGGPAASTTIVGLSGHATDDARAQGLEAGMDDYLSKPLRGETLKALLERVRNA